MTSQPAALDTVHEEKDLHGNLAYQQSQTIPSLSESSSQVLGDPLLKN